MQFNVLRVFMSVGRHFIEFHLISYIFSPMGDFYMQMINELYFDSQNIAWHMELKYNNALKPRFVGTLVVV